MGLAPGSQRTARRRLFLSTSLLTAVAVVAAGWGTDLRAVAHGALLAVAGLALLPLVLVGTGLALVLLGVVALPLVAIVGQEPDVADGSPLVRAGGKLLAAGGGLVLPYYRHLLRQRHPVFWGVPAGALLGGLALWLVLSAVVVPGEIRTVRILGETKQRIDELRRTSGSYPRPTADGHLTAAALEGREPGSGAPLVDGFGRPLHYEVSGPRMLSSFVLVSRGFDGEPGRDDLCEAGETRLARLVDDAAAAASLAQRIATRSASTRDELRGIRALRCEGR